MAQGWVYEDNLSVGWRPIQAGDIPSGGGSPLTTKGDLYGYSSTNARIPVGADNSVLTADSTQALGVKWAAAGGGSIATITSSGGSLAITNPSGPTTNLDVHSSGVTAGTYGSATQVGQFTVGADGRITSATNDTITGTPPSGQIQLFDSTLGSPAASIDTGAGGVPSGHFGLIIYVYARTALAAQNEGCGFTFNADTGTNQYGSEFNDSGSSGANGRQGPTVSATVWGFPASAALAGAFGVLTAFIPFYDSGNAVKVITGNWHYVIGSTNVQIGFGGVTWVNSAAISRVAFSTNSGGNLDAGSRMTIYGVS